MPRFPSRSIDVIHPHSCQHLMALLRLYLTTDGPVCERDGTYHLLTRISWDELFNTPALPTRLHELANGAEPIADLPELRAPIGSQEVWAAGVTYVRSKTARMEESKEAGGGDFYDRVYVAERPELFFKATAHRVSGPGGPVRIRRDTRWSVPEPELALAVNARGDIIGYTVGNDMSARDIEGENPLYLPQAKVYDQCCGLGPGLLIVEDPLPSSTTIALRIERDGEVVFEDATSLASLKRTPEELVAFLRRDQSFPAGCYLLTGTGIIPPDEFALARGDRIRITVEPIGTLDNHVIQDYE